MADAGILNNSGAISFGNLDRASDTRLKAATADQLETWVERILDAKTLPEVFSEH